MGKTLCKKYWIVFVGLDVDNASVFTRMGTQRKTANNLRLDTMNKTVRSRRLLIPLLCVYPQAFLDIIFSA